MKIFNLFKKLFTKRSIAQEKISTRQISPKPFHVQRIEYLFDKESRVLVNEPKWKYEKGYNTFQSGTDATRDFRRYSPRDKTKQSWIAYNSLGRFLKPAIMVDRYRVIEL